MRWKAPDFWQHKNAPIRFLFYPFSALYWVLSTVHQKLARPKKASIPVICIGNITLGGSGKTPTALALGHLLKDAQHQVHFVTRGYGGRLKGPLLVNAQDHSAQDVGDEALLLARLAPTWVSQNRYQGVMAAQNAGAQVVILDDGLQNTTVRWDYGLMVVDQKLGLGNGCLFPAGPLRETFASGHKKVDGIVSVGGAIPGLSDPQFILKTYLVQKDLEPFKGTSVVAFSGIAYPQKFFESLTQNGITLMKQHPFPDHYVFTEKDLLALESLGFPLVTTEKDWVRLSPAWRQKVTPLPMIGAFDNPHALMEHLKLKVAL